jgi:hypothetical protein
MAESGRSILARMSIRHRGRERPGIGPCLVGALFIGFGVRETAIRAYAARVQAAEGGIARS